MRLAKVTILVFCLTALLLALSACNQETRKLGAVLPLTGSAEVYGKAIQRGIDLAYEAHTNRANSGFNVELQMEDSGSDPERAKELTNQLLGSGALGVIGGVTSAEALAMVSVAHERERILLSPSASSPELSGASSSFYRIFPTSKEESVTMANFLVETLGLEEITIISEAGPFGEGAQKAFESVFSGEIEQVVTFSAGEDLGQVVTRAIEPKPKGLYLTADGAELAGLIKELRSQGFKENGDYILATTKLANPQVLADTGAAANGVYLTQTVFDLESEEEPMRGFVASYKAKYGEAPDFFAAHGYDAFNVFTEALSKMNGLLPSEFNKGMRGVQNFAGVTGNIQFRESGDVQKFMRIYFISEGQPVDFDKFMEQRRKEFEAKKREIERRRRQLMREQP